MSYLKVYNYIGLSDVFMRYDELPYILKFQEGRTAWFWPNLTTKKILH